MKILVLNAGSSSQKSRLYELTNTLPDLAPTPLWEADADWGEREASAFAWMYFFQGGRRDAATGLDKFGRRDYSASLGRWLQQDPLGAGESRERPFRAVFVAPLGVTYRVYRAKREVHVTRVWRFDPRSAR